MFSWPAPLKRPLGRLNWAALTIPLGGNVTAFLDSMKDAHSLRSAVHFTHYLRKQLLSQFDVFPQIVAGADLVVGASLVCALSTVAEKMGIDYRFVAFTPQLLPSGDHPFLVCKHHGFPHWYNQMTWRIAKTLDKLNLTRLVNQRRRHLGLKPVRDAWLHILGRRVILACDRVIAGAPRDVEPPVTQTGYMHLDQPDKGLAALEAFLSAGPAPVYAGFGSMPKLDQAKNVRVIVDAARSSGQRVIIAKFWDEPSEFSHSDDVFFIKKYPHLKLFPRMRAVIHHGGAGTTASSAISGVPQIVVPHALDQYYWGHKVYRSGLGPKPIWRSRLTSQTLAGAIRECLPNESMRRRAEAVAHIIRESDGLEMTAREVIRS